jgi:hypothetical protein
VPLPNLVLPAGDTVGIGLGSSYAQEALIGIPGDAVGDDRVDINDLTVVLANYGQTGTTWTQGDFTGEGITDIDDLTIVLANFGQSASAAPASVPEPSVTALLAIVALALLAFGRRRA